MTTRPTPNWRSLMFVPVLAERFIAGVTKPARPASTEPKTRDAQPSTEQAVAA